MEAILILAVPILIATAWLYTAQMSRVVLPNFRNKRICLLIAHPDDEAMFFSPTLLALTAEESGNHVKILCLSRGLHIPTLPAMSLLTEIVAQETQTAWATLASRSSKPQPKVSVSAPNQMFSSSTTRDSPIA